MSNRDAYITKMKLHLDQLNTSLTEFEVKARDTQQVTLTKYQAELSKLRHQSKLAIDRLDELKAAGEDSWKTLVAGTERVRDAFINSFHHFKSQQ